MTEHAQFRPATFEERGTAVPFTTAKVSQTRVRLDERDHLVLVMPSMAGGAGSYVVPWKAVPEIVTMTVHDRMLHEEILAARACTPDAMRRTVLRVAATGLAGPAAAQAAEAAARADEEEILGAHFLLVLALFSHLGIPRTELMEVGRDATRWRAVARRTLNAAASELRIAPGELYQRMQDLARALAPIGIANAPGAPARLRRLLAQLADARHSIIRWTEVDRSEVADLGRVTAQVAGITLELADDALAELDRVASDMDGLLRDWAGAFPRLHQAATRLSWLLDGWDFVVSLWDHHRGSSVQERRDALVQIHRVLPLIPRKELARADAEAERRDDLRGRRVRPMQDWRTGKYDLDLVARIEAVKSRTLAGGEPSSGASPVPGPEPRPTDGVGRRLLGLLAQGAR
jgi:hypothetical protein